MQTVKILRELWRRRVLVSVLAALSILLGIALTYRLGLPPESRQYKVGVAGARILIDTPKSQFVEVAPLGADTLGQRANVLAALMAEGEVRAAIARRAGLAPADLLASSESSEDPEAVSPSENLNAPDINLLHTRVVRDSEGGQLPIIEVETQAPDTAGATRLVNAAVSGVGEYLDSKAAVEQIADRRRLRVSSLGINPGRLEVRGPGLLIGAGAAFLVFMLGCSLILAITAISRNWRQAEEDAQEARNGPDGIDGPADPRLSAPPPPARRAKLEPVADSGWHHPEKVVDASGTASRPEATTPGEAERPLRRARRSPLLAARQPDSNSNVSEVNRDESMRDTRSPDAASGH